MLKINIYKIKNTLERRCLLIDLWNLSRILKCKNNFQEKHKIMKEGLQKIYNEYNYSERALLKRLHYLQNGLGLYQSFYISLFISLFFFILSLFAPAIMEISSDFTHKIRMHQYMLENDTYYAEGYKEGIAHEEINNEAERTFSMNFNELSNNQARDYFDGYNYAINNGYGYESFNYLIWWSFIVYVIGIIVIYMFLKRQESNFDEYQTNSFEIYLLKKKLGIAENETKYYKVKLKNKGKKVRAVIDEMEITEEIDHIISQ